MFAFVASESTNAASWSRAVDTGKFVSVVFQCQTVKGHEVTHVSLVDSSGTCLLNELVKPRNKIINYLTRYSGVTEELLRPVQTTLQDVQVRLRALLPSDAVLVGHSIDRDLIALKLIHPHVIDTSVLYKRDFGQKFKLKVLTDVVLRRQIQTEEQNGHDPVEDALAALELAQYFIQTGPAQVVERHLGTLWGYTVAEEALDCIPGPSPVQRCRFSDVMQTLGHAVVYLGKRSDVELDLSKQRWHKSDKKLLASFKKQTNHPLLAVTQFFSFSDQLKLLGLLQEQLHESVCADLRDMCVVFAGPFPAAFSERDVRRLFRSCGPLQRIRMLNTIYARVEFKLLEGATLAVKTLHGLCVHGQSIKVQRPVHDFTLDLDVMLDTLMVDTSNACHLYAVKLKRSQAECIRNPPEIHTHTQEVVNCSVPMNGLLPAETECDASQLTEESLAETFGRFGPVDDVLLLPKTEKQPQHAHINFQSSEGKQMALGSSDDLRRENYLVCPSTTPRHLRSWVAMATSNGSDADEAENATHHQGGFQAARYSKDEELIPTLAKVDHLLGKLFRSLPEGTLSVVLLPGLRSGGAFFHGLCLMEVKQECREESTS